MNKFKIGDRVKFLNAVGGGIVKRVEADLVYVEDETGFDMPFAPNELVSNEGATGVAKAFVDDNIGRKPTPKPQAVDHGLAFPTIDELEDEIRRLRNQNANLQDQIKQLKSQVLSLQRTIARIS